MTGTIIVGYDGTVVQQGPRERETCSAADHICTCAYRYWPWGCGYSSSGS